jgi:hypothetical protein
MCGCRPLEYAQKISLGSWIKPIGFDLCHIDLRTVLPRYRPQEGTKGNNRTSKKRTTIPSTTEAVKLSTEIKDNTGIKGTTSRIPHRSPNSPSDNQEERLRLTHQTGSSEKGLQHLYSSLWLL